MSDSTPTLERVARAIDPDAWETVENLRSAGVPRPNELCDRIAASLSAARAALDASGNDELRQQGQAEGFAAAVQWLRDRSAMKPPAALWHAASLLADQLEQSRIPRAAIARAQEQSDG